MKRSANSAGLELEAELVSQSGPGESAGYVPIKSGFTGKPLYAVRIIT
jgi:hypothetical protein